MSERKFPNKGQGQRSSGVPHSEKSAVSAKESHASKMKAAELSTKLHDLVIERDWAGAQAERYWEKAKGL
jgi:hypothetical protein